MMQAMSVTSDEQHNLIEVWKLQIPSGKRLHNYGKSTIFNGKTHYVYGHVQ